MALHFCEISGNTCDWTRFSSSLYMYNKRPPTDLCHMSVGGLGQPFLFLLARRRRISAFILAAPDPCKPVI